MALLLEEENYVKEIYNNRLLDIQIGLLEAEMWVEVGKILDKDKDKEKWSKRKLKKDEYYEMIQELMNLKV